MADGGMRRPPHRHARGPHNDAAHARTEQCYQGAIRDELMCLGEAGGRDLAAARCRSHRAPLVVSPRSPRSMRGRVHSGRPGCPSWLRAVLAVPAARGSTNSARDCVHPQEEQHARGAAAHQQ